MIWVAFGSFLGSLGTILVVLYTISARLVPQVSARADFIGFSAERPIFVLTLFCQIWYFFVQRIDGTCKWEGFRPTQLEVAFGNDS